MVEVGTPTVGKGTPTGQNRDSEAPIEINSDFLSCTAPERKSARLSSALLNYSRPDGINLIPLGSSWGLDVFSRLHNGLRRELIDMYNMVDSMQKRVQEIRTADLNLFFIWWDLFSSYLETTFACHDELLWPWITSKLKLSDCAPDLKKEETKKIMDAFLKKFDVIYDQISRRPPDETMAKMIKALADVHPIVEYFERIEANLPDHIESAYNIKEARKIERKISSYMHHKGDQQFRKMHLLVMSRGMTDQLISAWRKTLSLILRLSYRSATKRFQATHLHAVNKLGME